MREFEPTEFDMRAYAFIAKINRNAERLKGRYKIDKITVIDKTSWDLAQLTETAFTLIAAGYPAYAEEFFQQADALDLSTTRQRIVSVNWMGYEQSLVEQLAEEIRSWAAEDNIAGNPQKPAFFTVQELAVGDTANYIYSSASVGQESARSLFIGRMDVIFSYKNK